MVSEDDADQSASPPPAKPSVHVASWAPKLSKAGYYTTPSLSELNGYSVDELSQVEGFSITRSGVGTIRWTEPVDLVGADLDRTVVLEQGVASVYDCFEGGGESESRAAPREPQSPREPQWGDSEGGSEKEPKEPRSVACMDMFTKPPRGEKLNVPATVTMHGIFPKPGTSPQRVRAYPTKVAAKTNALPGATFLSYSLATGDWVFATEGW